VMFIVCFRVISKCYRIVTHSSVTCKSPVACRAQLKAMGEVLHP
jgi:hypothetical protein